MTDVIRQTREGNDCLIHTVYCELEPGVWIKLERATGYFDRGWEKVGIGTPEQLGLETEGDKS